MKKRMYALLLLVLMILGLCASALAQDAWDIADVKYLAGDIETTAEEREKGNPIFVIVMENGGEIRGELYPEIAPQSVGNFIALANSGYYDGKIFHRVIPGFMIQGGSPEGTGIGGPGWNIKGEFKNNGVENDLKHSYGVLSMARTMASMDSAGCQFFLMTADSPHLDGDYAAFGKALSGMEVAEAIVSTKRDAKDKPVEPQVIQSIRVETFEKEYPFDKL